MWGNATGEREKKRAEIADLLNQSSRAQAAAETGAAAPIQVNGDFNVISVGGNVHIEKIRAGAASETNRHLSGGDSAAVAPKKAWREEMIKRDLDLRMGYRSYTGRIIGAGIEETRPMHRLPVKSVGTGPPPDLRMDCDARSSGVKP